MPGGRLRIFFDGGCRPNPGRIEVAAVARGVTYRKDDIGIGGNEEAEWLALLHAVEMARNLGAQDVELLGDSRSVINQAAGTVRSRSPHGATYRAAIAGIPHVRLRYVPRSKNLAGIALAQGHPR